MDKRGLSDKDLIKTVFLNSLGKAKQKQLRGELSKFDYFNRYMQLINTMASLGLEELEIKYLIKQSEENASLALYETWS